MKNRINVFFDMDGTVADLYGRENWLTELRSNISPFEDLNPLVDMEVLDSYMKALKARNFHFSIITWTPMEATYNFHKQCEADKREWVTKYMPSNSQFDALRYGVPKQHSRIVNRREKNILIDDNPEVIEVWKADGNFGILVDETFSAIDALELLYVESNTLSDLNLNFNF